MPTEREAMDALEKLIQSNPVEHKKAKTTGYIAQMQAYEEHRKWLATAWMLGASYRQLGTLGGVTHASIVQAVGKELDAEERTQRLATSLSPTAIIWFREQYKTSDITKFGPLSAAKWLLEHRPFPGD